MKETQPLPKLTAEEEQLSTEIRDALKNKDIDTAKEKITSLLSISKNEILKKQYKSLYGKIEKLKNKEEKEESQIKAKKSDITFKEVKGMGRLKKGLSREIFLMINNREAFIKHHLKPSGLLLYGPPGVGKTFFLQAVAGEFGMYLIDADLATIFSQWVGETEKNIKKIVDEAVAHQPCLIILDETDAKLRNRANIEARGESVVNLNATTQFLETMQNVHNANYQVIFAGATNRVWDVDPAAKRPGRLGTMIYVPSPGLKDRFLLFRHYLKTVDNLKISPFGFFLLSLATSGYSSSEIEEICILAKKEMIYKNSNKAQLYTKEEYLRLKAENKLPHQSKENLSAKDVAKILKAPENRNSSLDIWYVESYKYMMGWSEIEKRTIKGKIFSKTSKEKVKHDGKLTGDERKVYKDMLKDIKRVHKHFWYIKLLRKTKWFIML